jgi:hypothetical protein
VRDGKAFTFVPGRKDRDGTDTEEREATQVELAQLEEPGEVDER